MKYFPTQFIANTQLCCVIVYTAVNTCPLYMNPSCSQPVDVTADVEEESLVSIICPAVKKLRRRQEAEKQDE